MILAVAATELEMAPFLALRGQRRCHALICGVGPVESGLRLYRFLTTSGEGITAVMLFGVAGAFTGGEPEAALLDVCLAESEVLGDLGICFPRRLDSLPAEITGQTAFALDRRLRERAGALLAARGIATLSGAFVTVASASGTEQRGEILREKYDGLCENMEGAAIARVCAEFALPLLQVRCISNLVENRDPSRWQLRQACENCGRAAAFLLEL